MSIKLFSHNETAYNAAVSMLSETGKAAVIHPTGTGKSFIGFKLCEDNSDKTVCWLSPSEYIFRTQIENLKASANGCCPDNIKYFTYARLMNMTSEEIAGIAPDYIILDEFHRVGAQMWQLGVEKLLAKYPNADILGLSATAIRYLDNQRDMADELFDGNIASEMTLGEAIVRGVLNPPKYVLSIFSYKESLAKYEIRVKKAQNKAVKDKAEQYLEALRRALDKAEGLDIIFDKHMTDRTGKYIVFCANYEAMQEAIAKVHEWFSLVDNAPHVYSVYSLDNSASKSFDNFRADNDSTHLRLLFCIDALNEGIHVENVSGVILLRPTVSPIVYKQQIGRALSASKTTIPVIFDIVNNIENLYSIDSIKEEMKAAIRTFHEYERDGDIVNDTFEVTDEVHECVEMFNSLEETLTASWDIMFMEAKRYYEQNGDLLIPQAYVSENGYRIGHWLSVQRANYHKGQYLTDARIRRLESIGMCWLFAEDRLWNSTYEICKKYFDIHHTLDGISQYSSKAGHWLVVQRRKHKDNELSEDKTAKLDAIGMIWDLSDIWERHFDAAKSYYEQNGNLDIPAKYVTEDGLNLGTWYRCVRRDMRDGKLPDDKKQRLETIGFQRDSVLTRNWMDKYRLAKQYYNEHGDLNVKSSYKCTDGSKLGVWISTQRTSYIKGKLSSEQIKLLEEIGMSWNRDDARWEQGFEYAKQYAEKIGDINDISEKYVADDFQLTAWIRNQRDKYKRGKLSRERIFKLESIGMKWSLHTSAWENNYNYAREYFLEHGDLNAPPSYVCADGFKLGVWLTNLRTKYKGGKLSREQIKRLEAIGMTWEKNKMRWENELSHAQEYYAEHGDLRIPPEYICKDGYRLGAWLPNVRMSYRKGTLPIDKVKILEAMGIVWDPQHKAWERGFSHAKSYFQQHGDLDIPQSYTCDDGYKLGEWKRSQLRQMSKGSVDVNRLDKLRQIGIL